MNDIQTILKRFLEDSKTGELKTSHYPKEFNGLRMKVSFGRGGLAKVPWIVFLRDGQEVQNGIFPVYLYYKEQGCLILAKGISQANEPVHLWPNVTKPTIQDFLKSKFNIEPTRYANSYVYASYEDSVDIGSYDLSGDINALLSIYNNLDLNDVPETEPSSRIVIKQIDMVKLYKPFLLLAGLSGTGKTRFVRKQAEMTGSLESTYCLVSVRPDWHEPSDLLGYVSRLGQNGAEFITTEVLNFIVKAWIEMVDLKGSFIDSKFEWKPKSFDEIRPFWLCLDEMNLAPVEQYFADYLSVIETRKWEGGVYSCEPLLKPDNFKQLERAGLDKLRKSLNLEDKKYQALWNYFVEKGVSIPFNLIVAGTVNMDETTHGFSRKVIDRALTFDFGAFFPNDFDQFFDSESEFKVLTYPQVSQAERADFSDIGHADLTIAFMKEVNGVLKGSLFELAYRALNECLIAVAVSQPNDDATLQAVWDDFLMMKVLPRIEGDIDKLQSQNPQATDKTLLDELEAVFEAQLNEIWADDRGRPDLFRVRAKDGSTINVKCRSKEKIKRMKTLLDSGFTSFWP